MAGRKVRFSVARVVSKRRTTGTSSVARVCYGNTSYAYPSLHHGAVRLVLSSLSRELTMSRIASWSVWFWAVWLWAGVATLLSGELEERCLDNWHQWRGPLASGMAPHGDPPIELSETNNMKWKVAVPGEGHASPIVWDQQVFVLSAEQTDRKVDKLAPPAMEPPGGYKTRRPMNHYRFVVNCFDRESGRLIWRQVACEVLPHEGRHGTNSYASSSPATDGQRLYVSFGSRGLFCYDLDGQLLWHRDLGDMITRMGWGEGASPVVHGDNLIVNWDHEGASFVVVLDPATGEMKWRAERDEATSWVTPRVVEYAGRTQLVVPATRQITSYDLVTGEVIWTCGGLTTNVIPSPVVYDDLIICISGHRGSEARAVRLDSRGDVTNDPQQVVWQYSRDTPYVPSPLLQDNLLYFTKGNTAVMTCLDPASGKVLQSGVRLPELRNIYASPVGAAGHVYFSSREGTILVIKNQPTLEVVSVNQLAEGIDASPAIVGKNLFVRGTNHLYCFSDEQ